MIEQHLLELGWNDVTTIPLDGTNIYVCFLNTDPRIEFPARYDVKSSKWFTKAHIIDVEILDFTINVIGWKHQHLYNTF